VECVFKASKGRAHQTTHTYISIYLHKINQPHIQQIHPMHIQQQIHIHSTHTVPQCAEVAQGRTLRFLANVDPVDVARATQGLDPEETLVCGYVCMCGSVMWVG
jgi:hypothetical protein